MFKMITQFVFFHYCPLFFLVILIISRSVLMFLLSIIFNLYAIQYLIFSISYHKTFFFSFCSFIFIFHLFLLFFSKYLINYANKHFQSYNLCNIIICLKLYMIFSNLLFNIFCLCLYAKDKPFQNRCDPSAASIGHMI